MKTTVELPNPTFRQVEILAASRGMTLKQFFAEALKEKLSRCVDEDSARETGAPWMPEFAKLSDLSNENLRILGLIEKEIEMISPEDLPSFLTVLPYPLGWRNSQKLRIA